jgi:hypothetical protein
MYEPWMFGSLEARLRLTGAQTERRGDAGR